MGAVQLKSLQATLILSKFTEDFCVRFPTKIQANPKKTVNSMTLGNELLLGPLLGALLEKSTSREMKFCRHELAKGRAMDCVLEQSLFQQSCCQVQDGTPGHT